MTARPYLYGTNAPGGAGSHASVTNGSDIVTGTGGPVWTSIAFGDFFSLGGMVVPILQIVDDTHLQLAYAWPGATASGQAYTISAGIADTDARRYGWTVQAYYQRLASLPTDTQAFRDQAAASATAAAASQTAAGASATLSQGWASTAHNVDVPGASVGSRSSLHWSVEAQAYATQASSNGAAQVALAAAQVAIASSWASAPLNTDVTGAAPGSRSALHYSATALATYNLTVGVYNQTLTVQSTVQGTVATVAAYAQLAADWAQKAVGADVNGAGTRSSYHWSTISQGFSNNASAFATNAAASAASAAANAALLASPDFGSITSAPSSTADWGTVP